VALLSVSSHAAQSNSPQSTAPAEQSTAEKLSELQLKTELELRQELSRLQKELENRSKPALVMAMPWIALGIVGLGFVVAWNAKNKRERHPETLKPLEERLNKLNEQVSELSANIGEISQQVTAVNTSINELWRTLAITRLMSSVPNP
jgi:hypothetical protein